MRRLLVAAALAASCSGSGGTLGNSFDAGAQSDFDAGAPGVFDAGNPNDSDSDAGEPPSGAPSADAGTDGGVAVAAPPDAGPHGGGDWLQYRHDQRGGSVNAGSFTVEDAAGLTPLWTFELGQYVYTQAMIASDLVVFTTAASGNVVAVDPATGHQKWMRTLNSPISTTCGGTVHPGIWAAAAIDSTAVYVASPDGNVYKLSRSDGSTLWSTAAADPTPAGHGEFIQSSPSLSAAYGKAYLGVASSFGCDEVAGRLLSLDLATGALQSKTLVAAGQQGAAVWSSITVAEDESRLYVTTGNQIGGAAAEPFAQAVLAVDPSTLEVLDGWQNPTALQDSDFGSSPALVETATRKLVAATNKDGWLYVLDRTALSTGPVWQYQMAVVDPSKPTQGGDASAGWASLSTPLVTHGMLVAAGGRTPQGEVGSVVAFDPDTGAVKWKHLPPGYVMAPMAAAGDVIAVESSADDSSSSTLEILNADTGETVATFPAAIATYGAPSIGDGLVVWTNALGHATAFALPSTRR
jgi:outer membrane protein assembly factor BamB